MKTGIVFTIENDNAVLLLDNGCFVRTKAGPGWTKGDIVPYRKRQIRRSFWAAAACIALLLTGLGGGTKVYYTESTVISMDINPSLEIGANLLGRVISITAMNQEAEQIIENLTLKNKNYEDALKVILLSVPMEEYLGKEREITLSVSADTNSEKLAQQLEAAVRHVLSEEGERVSVESLTITEDELEQAHHMGVTGGKYYYIKQLQQLGVKMDLEETCHHSIGELKEEIDKCSSHQDSETKEDHGKKHSHCH